MSPSHGLPMIFKDLYQYAETIDAPVVRVQELQRRITSHHSEVGEITLTPVLLDENTALGYVVYDYDRSSAYGDEFRIMGVRFSDGLNRCHRRFVCAKEMMHAFDSEEERASSRDRFFTLMRELETNPLPSRQSAMLNSENQAEWMALLALCPKPRRDALRIEMASAPLSSEAVAERILLPRWAIGALMSELYDEAYEDLVGSLLV